MSDWKKRDDESLCWRSEWDPSKWWKQCHLARLIGHSKKLSPRNSAPVCDEWLDKKTGMARVRVIDEWLEKRGVARAYVEGVRSKQMMKPLPSNSHWPVQETWAFSLILAEEYCCFWLMWHICLQLECCTACQNGKSQFGPVLTLALDIFSHNWCVGIFQVLGAN